MTNRIDPLTVPRRRRQKDWIAFDCEEKKQCTKNAVERRLSNKLVDDDKVETDL